jgi:hypothetical protein
MSYPSYASDGFDALWHDPLRWFARQFLAYGIVAAIVAAAILAGSGIYALFMPRPEPVSLPDRKPIITQPPLAPPKGPDETTGALVSQLPTEPIGKPIFVNGTQFGTVEKIITDSNGKVRFYVIARSSLPNDKTPRTFTVSADAIQWHTTGTDSPATGVVKYESVRSAFPNQ